MPPHPDYTCSVCNRQLSSKRSLNQHLRTHGAIPVKTLECPYPGCGHSTYEKEYMKRHYRRHTGEKPYKCTYPGCDFAFAECSKLSKHKKRIHGYIPRPRRGARTVTRPTTTGADAADTDAAAKQANELAMLDANTIYNNLGTGLGFNDLGGGMGLATEATDPLGQGLVPTMQLDPAAATLGFKKTETLLDFYLQNYAPGTAGSLEPDFNLAFPVAGPSSVAPFAQFPLADPVNAISDNLASNSTGSFGLSNYNQGYPSYQYNDPLLTSLSSTSTFNGFDAFAAENGYTTAAAKQECRGEQVAAASMSEQPSSSSAPQFYFPAYGDAFTFTCNN